MDLRNPDLSRDLGLAQPLEVREPEQPALALVKDSKAPGEGYAALPELVAWLEQALAVELAVLTVDELRNPRSERRIEFLEPARNPDRPGPIA